MIVFPAASIAARRSPPAAYSVELGRTMWGSDYLERNDAPPGAGVLVTLWTRIPEAITSYPYTRGNMEAVDIYGSNWNVRCVCGNIVANSAVDCGYNANSMMIADGGAFGQPNGTYLGDFSYLQDTGQPVARVSGWVFVAWQVVIGASDVTIRQWVKYAGQPVQGPQASTIAISQLRTWAENNGWAEGSASAWTPSAPSRFSIGTVNDNCNGFYTRARVYGRTDLPTNAEIEAVASRSSADSGAWGDWALTWDTGAGAAVLADRSGNGRALSIHSGGTLYQGPIAALG